MHPIITTVHLGPQLAQVLAILVSVGLSAYVVWDGLKLHGRTQLPALLAQAALVLAVGLGLSLYFLTPGRLPPELAIDIRSWGVMVVVGMYSCFFIQRHYGQKVGLTGDQILSIWVYGGLLAVVGARGLHVLVNWSDYAEAPLTALKFWDGGMAFIGAAVIAAGFSFFYLRRLGQGLVALDALALGVAMTHGLGRIGCFLAGCCYGQATDLPVGVSFPVGSIAQFTQAQLGLIQSTEPTAHLHPTQLYEAAFCFLIGFFLWSRYRRGAVPGTIIAGYFALYPFARFFVELVRDDPEREFLFRFPAEAPVILSTTQTSALVLVPLALLVIWRLRSAPSKGAAQAAASSTAG